MQALSIYSSRTKRQRELNETNTNGKTPMQLLGEAPETMPGDKELMAAISRRHARRLQHVHRNKPKAP